jgi:YaiO family outer membrane protein
MNFPAQFEARRLRSFTAVVLILAFAAFSKTAHAQKLLASTNPARTAAATLYAMAPATAPVVEAVETLAPPPPQITPVPPQAPRPFLGRFEVSQWGSSVSDGFGTWYGGGAHLFLDPSPRLSLMGELFYEHRPGETEQAGAFGATIHLTPWFYTALTVSGGGPDDPAAFIPRYRYDVNGTLRTPIPGFHLTGGWTRLEYGNPVSGRIARAGFLHYAGKVILQGTVNFNNVRPGNHKSVDGIGSIQVGEEGRYWVGFTAGGGREAWQTQGLFPTSVEFDGFNLSFFTRVWLARSFGVGLRYNHFTKKTAYHSDGGEVRFFWQF